LDENVVRNKVLNAKTPFNNAGAQPLISVIIPAYNEAAYIKETVLAAQAAAAEYCGPVEFIVVDNNSSDKTAEIARSLDVTVVFEPVNQIARARNAGAAAASGEYLVFVDADTCLQGDILAKVAANLASGNVIGGGAWVEPDSSAFSRFLFKYLVNFGLSLKNVSVGPFLYCEREAFCNAGGFDQELYAAEEFSLAEHMKTEGRKMNKKWKIIKHGRGHKIITSSRRFGRFGGLEMLFRNIHLLWKGGKKLRKKDQCSFWYQAR
jgi:glycosyltransferase involved in cell wall biosynthesis